MSITGTPWALDMTKRTKRNSARESEHENRGKIKVQRAREWGRGMGEAEKTHHF
jgi:hypothetical protein